MKTLIAAAVVLTGTYGAAGEVQEALDVLVPETARVVSDISLDQLYIEAYAMTIDGVPLEVAYQRVADAFTEEDIVYTVEEGTLVVRTNGVCRKLAVTDGLAVKTVDC